MIKIAVIEDVLEDRKQLLSLVERYCKESNVDVEISCFESATAFLEAKIKYDVIFLDIMLPGCNGMEMAHHLRLYDKATDIVFVTGMEQYAIEGYSVDAVGFLLKPVKCEKLRSVLDRVVPIIKKKRSDIVTFKTYPEPISVETSIIEYAEANGKSLVFHTLKGDIQTKGTLKELVDKLEGHSFIRCNSHTIVNTRYIRAIRNNTVIMPSVKLEISRRKRSEFIDSCLRYMGGLP